MGNESREIMEDESFFPFPSSPFLLSPSRYFAGLRKLYRNSTRSGIGVPLRMAGKKCS
jgi:hypothetical protein